MGRSNEERNRLNDRSWTRITFDSRDKRALFSIPYDCVCTVSSVREEKKRKKKKRKAVNLDAKSLLNGSWQTMGDVNLFILLRMYRASCIILPPRVLRRLRFIIFYWNFTLRFRSNFSRASFLYLSIFQISRAWEISNSTCKSYLFDSFVSYSFQYSPLFTIVRSELP